MLCPEMAALGNESPQTEQHYKEQPTAEHYVCTNLHFPVEMDFFLALFSSILFKFLTSSVPIHKRTQPEYRKLSTAKAPEPTSLH